MLDQASRQIMWNVDSTANTVAMYSVMVLSLIVAGTGVVRHFELISAGRKSNDKSPGMLRHLRDMLVWVLFQKGVVRRRSIGTAHTLIYLGFLALLFTTTMVFLDHDLGIHIYHGKFYLAVTLLSDILGAALVLGCAIAAYRRFVQKPDLLHNLQADRYMLLMLVLLCVQGFLLEGLRIHATQDPWGAYSPVGLLVAKFFWPLSEIATSLLHYCLWWFHTITVFLFIALIPYTKFFHIVASAANLYFRSRERPVGALSSPGDLEALIEQGEDFSIGLGTLQDYSWKQLLDLEACTSCGRCQDACPAYTSGKPLSPKWMILDTRNHALALHADGKLNENSLVPEPLRKMDSALSQRYLQQSSGVVAQEGAAGYSGKGSFRSGNPEVQNSVREIGASADARVSGDVQDPNVFWACTTCMACVEACPVGIQHVDLIVENRRNMVLMEGEIPSEAQQTLRALEARANPYGAPEDRINWLDQLDVPILSAGDSVDYLYWVGCVSAFDPRKQKIAQALVALMKKAGLSFGVLGAAEGCSGDPARRLGEENLFQTLAKSNLAVLQSIQFQFLVANCPHCFNTIKNEYPQFGNLADGKQPEIIHHSVLLRRLVESGKLCLEDTQDEITFHDPCYLGRYNNEYDAPREALRGNSKLKILEMEESREKSMCCGAGGGHFWMDLKIGERVNSIRIDQVAKTGAKRVATACPFCMQMLEDGAKLTGREDEIQVQDIAEEILERVK